MTLYFCPEYRIRVHMMCHDVSEYSLSAIDDSIASFTIKLDGKSDVDINQSVGSMVIQQAAW